MQRSEPSADRPIEFCSVHVPATDVAKPALALPIDVAPATPAPVLATICQP
jgi:hypothetical protein